MKNKIIIFILMIILSLTLSSCKDNANVSSSIKKSVNEVKKLYKLNNNEIKFDLDLENGTIEAEVNYTKSDLLGTSFLLNRDFSIQKMVCDGIEINADEIKKLINLDEDYLVNLYKLPKFEKSLKINYTGFLSGDTGISPYVREKISTDFTFLRWETFYYPIFADNWEDTLKFLSSPLNAEIKVNIPNGYSALSPLKLTSKIEDADSTSFVYYGNISDLNCAIAKYDKISLSAGNFYFLENIDKNKLDFITSTMNKSQQYMNQHFGKAEIPKDMKYIVIPENFGSFAPVNAIYIDESAFKSEFDMGQLIHEFIHIGWNAKASELEVQRSRFFDEGFTSYFTARVLGELLREETYISEIERYKEKFKSYINTDNYKLVPLSEYGKYEYGNLSYLAGPVFFDELSKLVGVEKLDNATKLFLEKYKNKSVDFDIMCKEYIELCDNPELEKFFDEWIFTTEYYKNYIQK